MKFTKENYPKSYAAMVENQKRKKKIIADNMAEVKQRLREKGRMRVMKTDLTAAIIDANNKAPRHVKKIRLQEWK